MKLQDQAKKMIKKKKSHCPSVSSVTPRCVLSYLHGHSYNLNLLYMYYVWSSGGLVFKRLYAKKNKKNMINKLSYKVQRFLVLWIFGLNAFCMRVFFQRLPWIGRSQPVVLEYMMFLSNLVSAQTVYLCACLRMVVSHFTQSRFLWRFVTFTLQQLLMQFLVY